jgi:cell division protein FtsI (penicillin-binding protein 3)
MKVNFFQLLSAYNVFNNDGLWIKPTIGHFYKTENGKKEKIELKKTKRVLEINNAHTMSYILQKTVKDGTGKKAYRPDLIVGGKTGTAHISIRGHYEKVYNSSFFGFANGKNRKYTIGVTVIEPSPKRHFASQNAVPVFRDIVDSLVDQKFLIKMTPQRVSSIK